MKKKLLSIVLTLCMVVSLLSAVTAPASAAADSWSYPSTEPSTPFSSGNGTEASPYAIATAQQLANLAYLVNNAVTGYCGSTVYYELSADIALNDWTDDSDGIVDADELSNSGGSAVSWIPIGDSSNSFTGTLSGNGCTISGIYISGSDKYQGLFGYISDGTITNINVENSYISSLSYIGGIAGYCSNATITNCKNIDCTIISNVPINSGYSYAGGIIGSMKNGGSVTDCSNTGSVSGTSVNATAFVGGITGSTNQGTVANCRNTGSVYGRCSNYPAKVGGITGYSLGGTVIACSNAGYISGIGSPSNISIAGLVGEMSGGTLADSHNTGAISGEGGFFAYGGGVVGYNGSGSVSNCYNSASVFGIANNNANIGGVAGYSTGLYTYQNCYNSGSVTGAASTSNAYCGGVLGYVSGGNAVNCYSTGSVTGTGPASAYVGAVCGYNYSGTMNYCYWFSSATQTVNGAVRTVTNYSLGSYRYGSVTYVAGTDDYTNNFSNSGITDCYAFSGSGSTCTLSNEAEYTVTPASADGTVTVTTSGSLVDALNVWVDLIEFNTWEADSDATPANDGYPVFIPSISGTPTIAVTNGYGDSSDQLKIGATLTATANTTPDTNLFYQWQVSADGSTGWSNATGTGNDSAAYTVSSADVVKYLRVMVTSADAPRAVYSSATAQVPYTITLSKSSGTGTDDISFSNLASVSTTYAVSGGITLYYTLDSSGTDSNALTYSSGTITQVTSSGTGSSSYTVSSQDASSGVIAITAAFSHSDLISGTPIITITNGYGDGDDQIKIGATLTATANTTPDTNISYQWQVSANGSDGWTSATGSGNNTPVYTVAVSDVTKYLRVTVTSTDASGSVYSEASAQVPYTITLSLSGNSGTDAVSFSNSSSVTTTYATSGSVAVYYTLAGSGTGSNTLIYSGGSITQVTSSGTGSSSYTVSGEDDLSGVITVTAAFSHINLITGTPTITVTNGYGDSSDQIKIGATLIATANTTPDTNLFYQWQVSANGSDGWTSATGSGNNTAAYTVAVSDVTKYLRVTVTSTDASDSVYSIASAQVPYTITLFQSENTGTDAVSFSDSSSVATTYAAGGSVAIYYTLDDSGTKSNTLSYSGGTITQVTASGTGDSTYTISGGDASNGVIAISSVFAHTNYGDITGTPTITVTNGYGNSSNQIKIGATLTALPNTTPSTNLTYQWQVSENGSDGWTDATGTGNDTSAYNVAAVDVTKYLRVKITSTLATSAAYSAASAQVPYTITLSQSGNTGTDTVSLSDASSVSTAYATNGSITIYYTLNSSGTLSNTLSYSGGTVTQVTASGTGNSTYTISGGDATDGVIAILATFMHNYYSNSSSSTPASGAPVIINGQSQTAGTSETTTENGQTKTTVTIDTAKLEDILNSEGVGSTVIIPINEDSNSASGVLTGEMVKSMEEKGAILEVQTASAVYTLPASEIDIDAISEQFGVDIDLSDIEVEITIAEPSDQTVIIVKNAAEEGGFSLMVPAVEFTVECTYNGITVEVGNYNAYVERTIQIPDGVDPNEITTAIVVETDGTVRHIPTRITVIDGVYYAVINSLTNSVYTLIYNPVEFEDVEGHWAQDAVNDMASRKVIEGYPDGTFNPGGDITRAEFAAIVVRALGLVEGMGENAFNDVSSDQWYCGYIETASGYGIINGYGDGRFGPEDNITCEQAMTVIARAMAITGLEYTLTDSEIEALLESYSDAADAAEYARECIAACLTTEVVTAGEMYTLAVKEYITRAEVAVIVQQLLQKSDLI